MCVQHYVPGSHPVGSENWIRVFCENNEDSAVSRLSGPGVIFVLKHWAF